MPNILDKTGKVAGIHKNIMNITKGLGSYTFECTLIYLKSMIRGTTLNACETCYNMNEKEYMLIESYEERLLIEAIQTGSKCPRAILYLELGLCPARFIIKKFKLNFLHYILNQDDESLLKQFFKAQMDFPVKGDWVSEMKELISDLDIAKSFEEVKNMRKNHYESLVNTKVKAEAFKYLLNKVKTKGSLINYGNSLEMQNYLKPNAVLTFQEQVHIFSYRSEMNELVMKYIHGYEWCICKEEMNNAHIFQCKLLNNDENPGMKYNQILNGTLHQQKKILNIMEKNIKLFKERLPRQPEPTVT